MASDVNDTLRRQVAERAYHVCEYCLIHEDDTNSQPTWQLNGILAGAIFCR